MSRKSDIFFSITTISWEGTPNSAIVPTIFSRHNNVPCSVYVTYATYFARLFDCCLVNVSPREDRAYMFWVIISEYNVCLIFVRHRSSRILKVSFTHNFTFAAAGEPTLDASNTCQLGSAARTACTMSRLCLVRERPQLLKCSHNISLALRRDSFTSAGDSVTSYGTLVEHTGYSFVSFSYISPVCPFVHNHTKTPTTAHTSRAWPWPLTSINLN